MVRFQMQCKVQKGQKKNKECTLAVQLQIGSAQGEKGKKDESLRHRDYEEFPTRPTEREVEVSTPRARTRLKSFSRPLLY